MMALSKRVAAMLTRGIAEERAVAVELRRRRREGRGVRVLRAAAGEEVMRVDQRREDMLIT